MNDQSDMLLERLANQLTNGLEEGDLDHGQLESIEELLDEMAEADGEIHAELIKENELLEFRNDELDIQLADKQDDIQQSQDDLTQELLEFKKHSRILTKNIHQKRTQLELLLNSKKELLRQNEDLSRKQAYFIRKSEVNRVNISEANYKAVSELAHQCKIKEQTKFNQNKVEQLKGQLSKLNEELKQKKQENLKIKAVLKEILTINESTKKQMSFVANSETYRKSQIRMTAETYREEQE